MLPLLMRPSPMSSGYQWMASTSISRMPATAERAFISPKNAATAQSYLAL